MGHQYLLQPCKHLGERGLEPRDLAQVPLTNKLDIPNSSSKNYLQFVLYIESKNSYSLKRQGFFLAIS